MPCKKNILILKLYSSIKYGCLELFLWNLFGVIGTFIFMVKLWVPYFSLPSADRFRRLSLVAVQPDSEAAADLLLFVVVVVFGDAVTYSVVAVAAGAAGGEGGVVRPTGRGAGRSADSIGLP
jgi:hypothetical protein